MTTWAEFCAGSYKDSQAVCSLRLGSLWTPSGEGRWLGIVRPISVGVPSCFPSDFPDDAETGLEWQSDSCLSVLEQPRTDVRNAEEGWVNLGTAEGCHSCPLGFEIRCPQRS